MHSDPAHSPVRASSISCCRTGGALRSRAWPRTFPPSNMRNSDNVGADGRKWSSDINWVIMDYLVSEGYPGSAEKFAQETNLPTPVDDESIRERVKVRNAIHAGKADEAIEMLNEIDPRVSKQLLSCPRNWNDYIVVSCTTQMHHVDANSHFSPQYDPNCQLSDNTLHQHVPGSLLTEARLCRSLTAILYSASNCFKYNSSRPSAPSSPLRLLTATSPPALSGPPSSSPETSSPLASPLAPSTRLLSSVRWHSWSSLQRKWRPNSRSYSTWG